MAYHCWKIGLQVQSDTIRAIAVRMYRGGWQLCQWWQIPIPCVYGNDQTRLLINSLADLRNQLPARHEVRMAFSATRTVQRQLASPGVLREADCERYVASTTARQIQMAADDLRWDYQPATQHNMLSVTAAHHRDIAMLSDCAAALRLTLTAITPDACALSSFFPWLPRHIQAISHYHDNHWLWATRQQWGVIDGIVVKQELAGQSMTGQGMAEQGMPGQSMAEQGMTGQSMPGQSMTGQSMAGQGMAEQGMTGQSMTEYGLAEQSMPGQSMTEYGLAEQSMPGQSMTEYGLAEQNMTKRGIAEPGLAERGLTQQGLTEQHMPRQNIAEQGIATLCQQLALRPDQLAICGDAPANLAESCTCFDPWQVISYPNPPHPPITGHFAISMGLAIGQYPQ